MEIEEIYERKSEPQKSCLYALRSIILKLDGQLSETIKYGMPCFCYGKKPFCYLWTDKKTGEPYILLVKGQYLNHPELETGNRSRMKILRISSDQDIPIKLVLQVLNDALLLYK